MEVECLVCARAKPAATPNKVYCTVDNIYSFYLGLGCMCQCTFLTVLCYHAACLRKISVRTKCPLYSRSLLQILIIVKKLKNAYKHNGVKKTVRCETTHAEEVCANSFSIRKRFNIAVVIVES